MFRSFALLSLLLLTSCYDDWTHHSYEFGDHSVIIFDEQDLVPGITVENLGNSLIALQSSFSPNALLSSLRSEAANEAVVPQKTLNHLGPFIKKYGYAQGNSRLVRMQVRQTCDASRKVFAPTLRKALISGKFVCYDVVGYLEGEASWLD